MLGFFKQECLKTRPKILPSIEIKNSKPEGISGYAPDLCFSVNINGLELLNLIEFKA